ncbi:hypothetical protein GCM10012287_03820 [Streptomyces daqingensis]|uniref:PucR C-terminal helix-turn-helix domain-containing protein n=1 Tax=Streptomyces daqingensis TaxID=1472640 RepID=A0ABQ2LV38_9ACTN|nr:SAM-dependent methyltransferase [Streptomyces daqingensis]GGO42588.1 hypothetical protein GCM10012287_03820 [Streptomyces daqingensis]
MRLGDLAAPLLRPAGPPAAGARPVERVELAECAETVRAAGGDVLLVAPAAQWLPDAVEAAADGFAGLVVVGGGEAARRSVEAAAVPVLLPRPDAGGTAQEVWGRLLERLAAAHAAEAREARRRSQQTGDLMSLLQRMLEDPGGVDALAGWCARRLSARVRLLRPGADASIDDEGARRAVRELVAGASGGPSRTRVAGEDALAFRIGARAPHAVLLAYRARPWEPEELQLLEQAARAAGAALWGEDVRERERRSVAAAEAARSVGMQYLMAGDLPSAEPLLDAAVPALVAAGAGRIALLEAAEGEDRRSLAADVERTLAGQAVAVPSPGDERQVVVLHTGNGPLEEWLLPLVDRAPHRAAGVCRTTPWLRAAAGYQEAAAALALARDGPPRLRVHDGRAPLEERLGLDARIWAALVMQPLADLPDQEREDLLHLAGETLWWGPTEAARLVGWHRQTLAQRLDRLAALTGLDPRRRWQQSALYLAVRLAALPPPPVLDRTVTLRQVLDHPGARAWADERLDGLTPDLRETLAAWVAADMDKDAAAAALGITPRAAYRRLGRAVTATRQELTRYPGPASETALALCVTGDVMMGDVPAMEDRHVSGQAGGGERTVDVSEVDTGRPHVARVYDYLLGGNCNWPADREAAERTLAINPHTTTAVRENRLFMQRSVRTLTAEVGIRQFLDLGSGIPTSPNLHEIAQGAAPGARVVYVDHDPIVLAHAAALLRSTARGRTAYIEADVLDTRSLFSAPGLRDVLDLDEPVAVCINALVHFLDDDEAGKLIRDVRRHVAPGSYVTLTSMTADYAWNLIGSVQAYYSSTVSPLIIRTHEEIEALFAGMELLDPGVVSLPDWRPLPGAGVPPPPDEVNCYGGVARVK